MTIRTTGPSETPSSSSRSATAVPVGRLRLVRPRPTASETRPIRSSSVTIVVARGDSERELVARREAELVGRADVLRVGDRDVEHVALEPVRQRDRTLEDVQRDQRAGVGARRPTSPRSMSGRRCRAASIRATPSLDASPSATRASENEPWRRPARGRARAGRPGRGRVASIRSATSSADSSTPNGGSGVRAAARRRSSLGVARDRAQVGLLGLHIPRLRYRQPSARALNPRRG